MRDECWKNAGRVAVCGLEGAAAGLGASVVVGCFRVSHDRVFALLLHWLDAARGSWWTAPLWFAILFALAGIVGRLVRDDPLIPGSGIPQTEMVLAGSLIVRPSAWPRLLLAKFAGSWLAVTAGLSLGREGPSIQMGGAIGAMLALLRGARQLRHNPSVLAGAAGGMAAAFGAPAAGFLLVFEEMKGRRTAANLAAALAASCTAEAVIRHGFGLGRMFSFEHFPAPPLDAAWTLPVLGLALGGLGVVYNKSLLWLKDRENRQTLLPQSWRLLPPLLAAGALAFVCPQALGGGDGLIASLDGLHAGAPSLVPLFLVKFAFSLYSYTGNAPGGLLMPLLCLGALLGALAGSLLAGAGLVGADAAQACIVLGMAGYFAAIVRAPLTGTALVAEMSGAYACLPAALAVALLANFTASGLRCPPVYDSLRARIKAPAAPEPYSPSSKSAGGTQSAGSPKPPQGLS